MKIYIYFFFHHSGRIIGNRGRYDRLGANMLEYRYDGGEGETTRSFSIWRLMVTGRVQLRWKRTVVTGFEVLEVSSVYRGSMSCIT